LLSGDEHGIRWRAFLDALLVARWNGIAVTITRWLCRFHAGAAAVRHRLSSAAAALGDAPAASAGFSHRHAAAMLHASAPGASPAPSAAKRVER